MTLTERQKRLAKWAGYPLLALLTFILVMHYTFPYDRVKDKIVDGLSDKYDVTIASAGPTLMPGGLVLDTMALRTRPDEPDEVPTTIIIDELRVDVGLLALLGGTYDIDIDAKIGGGTIEGNVRVSKGSLRASLETSSLPLHNIPGLEDAVGLPMAGGLDAKVRLDVPKGNWSETDGRLKLACAGCTVGDGKSKIKPPTRNNRYRRNAAFASEGMTVPRLELGTFTADIDIKKGRGEVKQFGATSSDGELSIDGEIVLANKLGNSTFPGCLRFKLSDELKQRERDFGNLPMLMGVGLDNEGFANLRMTGKVSGLRWKPAQQCRAGGADVEEGPRNTRPQITTRPDRPAAPAARERERDEPPAASEDARPEAAEPEPTGVNNSGPELSDDARPLRRRGGDDVSVGSEGSGEPPGGAGPGESVAPGPPPGDPTGAPDEGDYDDEHYDDDYVDDDEGLDEGEYPEDEIEPYDGR